MTLTKDKTTKEDKWMSFWPCWCFFVISFFLKCSIYMHLIVILELSNISHLNLLSCAVKYNDILTYFSRLHIISMLTWEISNCFCMLIDHNVWNRTTAHIFCTKATSVELSLKKLSVCGKVMNPKTKKHSVNDKCKILGGLSLRGWTAQ